MLHKGAMYNLVNIQFPTPLKRVVPTNLAMVVLVIKQPFGEHYIKLAKKHNRELL